MINEETLGFFTNLYPYLPKPIPMTRGAGFLGLGYGLAQKTSGPPMPILMSISTVKFLGLHIDRELRWKEQVAAAIGKRMVEGVH